MKNVNQNCRLEFVKSIGVFEAKAHLSELIEAGEPVTITRYGRAVATLVPVRDNVSDVVRRIRSMKAHRLTGAQIVALTREGRP